jgi:putative ABC transport system permease protein
VVALGVMITVFLQAYMSGVLGDSIETSANFSTGQVKVMTRAYSENRSQLPNDLAIVDAEKLTNSLRKQFPNMTFTERIQFGGLLDVPDSQGETRAQGNVMGIAIDMLKSDVEIKRMDLQKNLLKGTFPKNPGDVMISDELFQKMNLKLGDVVTLISSSMYGEMAMYNFQVSGTLHFGINSLDRGTMIADINDVRFALNMENASGEILGYVNGETYDNDNAKEIAATFNKEYEGNADEFAPVMMTLGEMDGMGFFVAYAENMQFLIVGIFIIAMAIVLWNAGLIGALRRYGEFGLRLAIGESKREIYTTLIGEAFLIGIVGSIIGSVLGLLLSWYMQEVGLNVGEMLKDSTMMLPTIMRAHISTTTFYIGFLPGILSTVLGAMLAGIGIYKRQTANLFKELEA